MTMHLLPAYWTTTNHKKRKRKNYEWRVQTKRVVKEYKGNAVLGQAYNKGNLVVLSSTEAKDDATGKRR